MFRNMVTSLLKYERITTTDVKAKELRRWADHLITLAKRGDLHARRQALSIVREKDTVHKLFEEAREKFGKSSGGYTRIIKLGRRPGDAAPVSLIELIVPEEVKKKATKKKGKSKAEKAEKPQEPVLKVKEKKSKDSGAALEVKEETPDKKEAKAAKPPVEEESTEDMPPKSEEEKKS
jgi:large subunit ribosomal protein L17